MISKKLLSEVLGYEVRCCHFRDFNLREIVSEDGSMNRFINIYELAHKCKEWANKKGYIVRTEMHYTNSISCQIRRYKPTLEQSFYEPWKTMFKTEPEAIFKACEWILNETITKR